MSLDNGTMSLYTLDDLKRVAELAAQNAIARVAAQSEQLDNRICDDNIHSLEENVMKDYYPVVNGKTVHIRAKSKAEMQRKFEERYSTQRIGMPLGRYADLWLQRKLAKPTDKRIRETTAEEYKRQIRYMKRFFDDTDLSELTTPKVQEFADWMANGSEHGLRNDISEQTINRVLATLRQIVSEAVELYCLLPQMPYRPRQIANNGILSRHHKALPPELYNEVKKKIPAMADKQEQMFMALLATTGMRPEEIYGLRWEDISDDWTYIHIVRSVTYPDKNKPVVGKPKTSLSNRYVNLIDWVSDILRANSQKSGFIFGGDAPLSYVTRQRLQNRAWKSVGLDGKGICPYDFRANFATMLCESGQTDKQVADMMGHADTRMVDTIYAPARKEGILLHKYTCESLFGQQNSPENSQENRINHSV